MWGKLGPLSLNFHESHARYTPPAKSMSASAVGRCFIHKTRFTDADAHPDFCLAILVAYDVMEMNWQGHAP
jgi:hypothetical protein